ncbi:effector-associated constant component EACC1 [Actinomadura flavalba]|uniref:effector-associated constant component EACC1 n=1 Tax=Actinomadura flavalba TaxID=1120938 RepID=UPI00035E551E|nr:hypothetical protein [Actinomadura flavalba]
MTLIRFSGPQADDEARSFYTFLLDHEELRSRRVKLDAAAIEPGEMGGALETISLVIDNVEQLGSLILAYLTWRGTRPRRSPSRDSGSATIEHQGTTRQLGDEVKPENAEEIARSMERPPDETA